VLITITYQKNTDKTDARSLCLRLFIEAYTVGGTPTLKNHEPPLFSGEEGTTTVVFVVVLRKYKITNQLL